MCVVVGIQNIRCDAVFAWARALHRPPTNVPLQPVVRKQHNSGYKHKANVKSYFTQFEETMQQRQLEAQIRARMVGGLGCVLAVHA